MPVFAVPAHRTKDLDLLIRHPKNGRVFTGSTRDPDLNLAESNFDIGIADGKIVELRSAIPEHRARKVVKLKRGAIVTPGLVDIHTHLYALHSYWGINGDEHCLAQGTTLAADAGTAGGINILGLAEVLQKLKLETRVYVNICNIGLVGKHAELLNRDVIDLDLFTSVVSVLREMYPELVVGAKVRTGVLQVGKSGADVLDRSVEGAERAGLPLMVHVALQPEDLPLHEVTRRLRPGDIITHCFHGKGIHQGDAILDAEGNVRECVWEAMSRGIRFDVGHGMGSFFWDVARDALNKGFRPTSISSDIHKWNINGPVQSFPHVLSKFLHLGLSISEVLSLASIAPARQLNYEHGIEVGLPANLAVFNVEEGPVTFVDSLGQESVGDRLLVADKVFLRGKEIRRPRTNPPPNIQGQSDSHI